MESKEIRPFDLQTLPDMLGKLEREIERLEEADVQTRADMSDHAINFATTAWHMIEWAWDGIQGLSEDHRRALEDELKSSWEYKTKFRDWAKERCPELEACRQIASGWKHVETTMHRRAPIVEIMASAKGRSSLADVPLFEIQNAEHWVLKIRIAGERRPAKEVFRHVLVFWTSVVGYGLNIDW